MYPLPRQGTKKITIKPEVTINGYNYAVTGVAPKAFKGIKKNAAIIVPKKKYKAYKKDVEKFHVSKSPFFDL